MPLPPVDEELRKRKRSQQWMPQPEPKTFDQYAASRAPGLPQAPMGPPVVSQPLQSFPTPYRPDAVRPDGSIKGPGFQGTFTRPDGLDMTEFSVNVDGREIPTITSTTSYSDVELLMNVPPGRPDLIPQHIIDNANEHALGRETRGLSAFFNADENLPGLPEMGFAPQDQGLGLPSPDTLFDVNPAHPSGELTDDGTYDRSMRNAGAQETPSTVGSTDREFAVLEGLGGATGSIIHPAARWLEKIGLLDKGTAIASAVLPDFITGGMDRYEMADALTGEGVQEMLGGFKSDTKKGELERIFAKNAAEIAPFVPFPGNPLLGTAKLGKNLYQGITKSLGLGKIIQGVAGTSGFLSALTAFQQGGDVNAKEIAGAPVEFVKMLGKMPFEIWASSDQVNDPNLSEYQNEIQRMHNMGEATRFIAMVAGLKLGGGFGFKHGGKTRLDRKGISQESLSRAQYSKVLDGLENMKLERYISEQQYRDTIDRLNSKRIDQGEEPVDVPRVSKLEQSIRDYESRAEFTVPGVLPGQASGGRLPEDTEADSPELQVVEQGKSPLSAPGASGATLKDSLNLSADQAIERITKRQGGYIKSKLNPLFNTADLPDYAIIGAAKLGAGTMTLAEFSKEMIKEHGKDIKPYVAKLFEDSTEIVKAHSTLNRSLEQYKLVYPHRLEPTKYNAPRDTGVSVPTATGGKFESLRKGNVKSGTLPTGAEILADFEAAKISSNNPNTIMKPPSEAFIHEALRGTNESRFWYELFSEGGAKKYLRGLSPKEMEAFFNMISATSQNTKVLENMSRTLSATAEGIQGKKGFITDFLDKGPIGRAITGAISGGDRLKTSNFVDTMLYLSGLKKVIPGPTIDVIMNNMFGGKKGAAVNGADYETVSKFLSLQAKRLNKNLKPGEEPFQTWQLQALYWMNRDVIKNAPAHVVGTFEEAFVHQIGELKKFGIKVPSDKNGVEYIDRNVLNHPSFTYAVRGVTAKEFADSSFMTAEMNTLLTPQGKRARELAAEARATGDPKLVARGLGGKGAKDGYWHIQKTLATDLFETKGKYKTITGKIAQHKIYTWLYAAITGKKPDLSAKGGDPKTTDIRRIGVGDQKATETNVRGSTGSYLDATSMIVRVPMKGDATPNQRQAVLSFVGLWTDQDAAAAHKIVDISKGTKHKDTTPVPSVFIKGFESNLVASEAIKKELKARGYANEMITEWSADGTRFDLVPTEKEFGKKTKITENEFADIVMKTLPDHVQNMASDMVGFKTKYGYDYIPDQAAMKANIHKLKEKLRNAEPRNQYWLDRIPKNQRKLLDKYFPTEAERVEFFESAGDFEWLDKKVASEVHRKILRNAQKGSRLANIAFEERQIKQAVDKYNTRLDAFSDATEKELNEFYAKNPDKMPEHRKVLPGLVGKAKQAGKEAEVRLGKKIASSAGSMNAFIKNPDMMFDAAVWGAAKIVTGTFKANQLKQEFIARYGDQIGTQADALVKAAGILANDHTPSEWKKTGTKTRILGLMGKRDEKTLTEAQALTAGIRKSAESATNAFKAAIKQNAELIDAKEDMIATGERLMGEAAMQPWMKKIRTANSEDRLNQLADMIGASIAKDPNIGAGGNLVSQRDALVSRLKSEGLVADTAHALGGKDLTEQKASVEAWARNTIGGDYSKYEPAVKAATDVRQLNRVIARIRSREQKLVGQPLPEEMAYTPAAVNTLLHKASETASHRGFAFGVAEQVQTTGDLMREASLRLPPKMFKQIMPGLQKIKAGDTKAIQLATDKINEYVEKATRNYEVSELKRVMNSIPKNRENAILLSKVEEITDGIALKTPSLDALNKAEVLIANFEADVGDIHKVLYDNARNILRDATSRSEHHLSTPELRSITAAIKMAVNNDRLKKVFIGKGKARDADKVMESSLEEMKVRHKPKHALEIGEHEPATSKTKGAANAIGKLFWSEQHNNTVNVFRMAGDKGETFRTLIRDPERSEGRFNQLQYKESFDSPTNFMKKLGLKFKDVEQMSDSLMSGRSLSRNLVSKLTGGQAGAVRVKVELPDAISSYGKRAKSIKITPAQRIHFLMHMLDPDTRHQVLKDTSEGITFDGRQAYKLTARDIKAIQKSATKTEVAIAQELHSRFNSPELIAEMNRVSNSTMGFDVFTRTDVTPRRRSFKFEDKEPSSFIETFTKVALERMGILKERKGGNQPIHVGDAFSEFFAGMNRRYKFISSAESVHNAKRMLGNQKFQNSVLDRFKGGKKMLRSLNEMVEKFEGLETKPRTVLDQVLGNFVKKANVGILGLKPQVWAYQTLSLANAMNVIPAKFMTDPRASNPALFSKTKNEILMFADKNPFAASIRARLLGSAHNIMTPDAAVGESVRQFYGASTPLVELGLKPIHMADSAVIMNIWRGAKLQGQSKGLKGMGLLEYTADLAHKTIQYTQPTWGVTTVSQLVLHAAGNPAWKLLVPGLMFSSQRNKNLNMAIMASSKFNASQKTIKDHARLAKEISVPLLINAAGVTAIGTGVEALIQGRDHELGDVLVTGVNRLFGNWIIGGDIVNSATTYAKNHLREGKGYGRQQFMRLNIISGGADQTAAGVALFMEGMSKAVEKRVNETGNTEWQKDLMRAGQKIATGISPLTGWPLAGPAQWTRRLTNKDKGPQSVDDLRQKLTQYGKSKGTVVKAQRNLVNMIKSDDVPMMLSQDELKSAITKIQKLPSDKVESEMDVFVDKVIKAGGTQKDFDKVVGQMKSMISNLERQRSFAKSPESIERINKMLDKVASRFLDVIEEQNSRKKAG